MWLIPLLPFLCLAAEVCGQVPATENGNYSPAGDSVGSEAELTCNEGYQPGEGSTLDCLSGGEEGEPQWSPKGSCIGKKLILSYVIRNAMKVVLSINKYFDAT